MTRDQLKALSKITPGPWSAQWDDNGQWYVEPLGLTGNGLRGDSGECIEQANAVAIALLPDLLSERTEMLSMLKKLRYQHLAWKQFMEWDSADTRINAEAGALIARAEGRE